MTRHVRYFTVVATILALAWAIGFLGRSPADDKAAAAKRSGKKSDAAGVAAIRKSTQAFVKAFNAGDATALAAFWTKEGEYIGPDGEVIRGRAAIEKDYVEFFKKHAKATVEVDVKSIRLLGPATALEEGSLKLKLPGEKEPAESRYSVLHVREPDGWKMASVREWVPDPATLVTVKDVEWLLGEWVAKSHEAELHVTYAWDEDKAFLRGRYKLKRGSSASSGTQIIGKNPAGGLRSWNFDSSGTFGESVWTREANRWVIDATGTLPDGSGVTATNILVPLGNDAFTWQSVERTAEGSSLPDTAPLKVVRVKGAK